jgi:hypothetical protein
MVGGEGEVGCVETLGNLQVPQVLRLPPDTIT